VTWISCFKIITVPSSSSLGNPDTTQELPDTFTTLTEPVFPGTQWDKADPRSVGMDFSRFNDAMTYLSTICGFDGVSQVFIVRRGYVVYEGPAVDSVHDVWSCTKSFTSTCLGLMIDSGLCSLQTPAKELAPYLEKLYPNLVLRHFVTLTSGYQALDPTQPFLPGPPAFEPGTRFHYDEGPNMLAGLLSARTRESLYSLFKRRIADPIGMDSTKWRWENFMEAQGIAYNGGAGTQGRGIYISARELARFGLLLLNNGLWNGTRLLSEEWIEQASSVQVDTTMQPFEPASWYIPLIGAYGYNFWVNGVLPGGVRKWPEAPERMFLIQGNLNNNCFIIPDWEMVIVRLGQDQVIDYALYDTFFKIMRLAIICPDGN
jgi:CubicO group peptidase (beta-lactamase class C family)